MAMTHEEDEMAKEILMPFALAVAVACGSLAAVACEAPDGSAASGTGVCAELLAAHERLIACETSEPGRGFLVRQREALLNLWLLSIRPHAGAEIERTCALMLGPLVDGARAGGCEISMSAAVRDRVVREQTRRTRVEPTGAAEIDAAIREREALRDRACACADQACGEAALASHDALSWKAIQSAPLATQDQVAKVMEELSRCASLPSMRKVSARRGD
jgi:hypothetical protein